MNKVETHAAARPKKTKDMADRTPRLTRDVCASRLTGDAKTCSETTLSSPDFGVVDEPGTSRHDAQRDAQRDVRRANRRPATHPEGA